MTDKQKLLELLTHDFTDYLSFDDIVDSYIGLYREEFSAYRINKFSLMLNEHLVREIDNMEVATRVARERATYLKCYLEGNMYANEEAARACVGLQIENAKAILESTERVAL